MTRYFTFIGVTTGQSSIMQIFPRWRDRLGLGEDVVMRGVNLPLHAPTATYREVVVTIKEDPVQLGALVTTHKIDLYAAAHDLFDGVDHYARLCGEVSCIARDQGRLLGWAKDPISAGRALTSILGEEYFGRTGGEVLCLGAGGAGVAITLHLLTRSHPADRPTRVVVTDRSPERLIHLQDLHRQVESDVPVNYARIDAGTSSDALMEALPPGSLVINATGMGKDTPGSPLSDNARFPEGGIAWELNYRGELTFLRQAQRQEGMRHLRVEDGWQYFILGWTSVIEEVFNRPISGEDLEALTRDAAFARPSTYRSDRVRSNLGS